ncbi:hypothetical protein N7535_004651 [Penicillium sp. DV-2018c]|nr:hypothetical protein N7461_008231 [Penicillium sp. DV-2018c]KAJ5570991.1 hypothetical protein N7535_004651 [Penicillium sp. DV-2018c]
MGSATPTEAAPPYEDLFDERGATTRNGYAMVGQSEPVHDLADVEQGHRHDNGPAVFEITPMADSPNQHVHCKECDRLRERRERREHARVVCGTVALTIGCIAVFLMIFGIVALKTIHRKKSH